MPLDPALFRPSAISPAMRYFNAELAAALSGQLGLGDASPTELRRQQREGTPVRPPPVMLDVAEAASAAGPAGDVPLRIFRPDRVDGVYLHIHGGGWVLGSYDQQDEKLWALAQAANVAVVSVQYRLAPEHKYPAGLDDCEAAGVWLVQNSLAEFGSDRLLIGGESAGGHLSATTILRLRDRHGYADWAGADLVYGAFDFSGACPARSRIGRDSLIIASDSMSLFEDYFFGGTGVDPADPDISPLRAQLSSLPRALFMVGTADPLLDDSLFMYARWIAAGNEAEIEIFPGATHAFDGLGSPLAAAAFERRHRFARSCLRD